MNTFGSFGASNYGLSGLSSVSDCDLRWNMHYWTINDDAVLSLLSKNSLVVSDFPPEHFTEEERPSLDKF